MAEAAVGILMLKTNLPRPPADSLLEPFAAAGARLVAVGARAIIASCGCLAG